MDVTKIKELFDKNKAAVIGGAVGLGVLTLALLKRKKKTASSSSSGYKPRTRARRTGIKRGTKVSRFKSRFRRKK